MNYCAGGCAFGRKTMTAKHAARKLKKAFAAGIAACLLLCTVFSGTAFALEPWAADCYVLSEGACLMDADSGVTLFNKNADTSYYPASITKVITALLTIENCENLAEIVTFSYDAVHMEEENSTIIGASEGDRLSVLDCLYCLLFQSANEVANALAEHVGAKHPELKEKGMNDRDVFIKLMNEKAASLGCRGTHFNNPSGLTDSEHYTTPRDMCLIMAAAIRNPVFCDIESHTYWKHAPIRRYPDADDPWNTVYMKHLMLRKNSSQYYKGCIAGKTGYTMTAGNTLVTACKRDDMTLVACVMNAHANHYTDTEALFDFGFSNFKSVSVNDYDLTNELVQRDFRIEDVPVMDSYTAGIGENSRITIPKGGDYTEVSRQFLTEELSDENELAEFRFYYGEKMVGIAPVILMPLGGMNDVKAAREDPVFYQVSGLEMPTEESLTEEETEAGETADSTETGSPGETGGEESAGEETGGPEEESPESPEKAAEGSAEKSGLPAWAIILIIASGLAAVFFIIGIVRMKEKEKRRRMKRKRKRVEKQTGNNEPKNH